MQLRKIIRAIRSSPQRRAAWTEQVKISLQQMEEALDNVADIISREPLKPLMLILDVRTRWSSTHQMLRVYCYLLLVYLDLMFLRSCI